MTATAFVALATSACDYEWLGDPTDCDANEYYFHAPLGGISECKPCGPGDQTLYPDECSCEASDDEGGGGCGDTLCVIRVFEGTGLAYAVSETDNECVDWAPENSVVVASFNHIYGDNLQEDADGYIIEFGEGHDGWVNTGGVAVQWDYQYAAFMLEPIWTETQGGAPTISKGSAAIPRSSWMAQEGDYLNCSLKMCHIKCLTDYGCDYGYTGLVCETALFWPLLHLGSCGHITYDEVPDQALAGPCGADEYRINGVCVPVPDPIPAEPAQGDVGE